MANGVSTATQAPTFALTLAIARLNTLPNLHNCQSMLLGEGFRLVSGTGLAQTIGLLAALVVRTDQEADDLPSAYNRGFRDLRIDIVYSFAGLPPFLHSKARPSEPFPDYAVDREGNLIKRNTTFRGDVLRLVSGTGIAQIITLIAAPILTRLYAPDAFGVAALFASITGILGVLACMRYELSIVLPDNDREAANLLAVSLSFTLLMALITVLLVEHGGPYLLAWARMPELRPYLSLVPVMVLLQGIFTALNYWNTRTKHFTRLSIARVTSTLASTTGSLGAGIAGHATGGAMIAAQVGGQAVATTVLGGQIWRDNGRFFLASITWREMWEGVKRHRKFPVYGSWAGLLNTLSWQLPVLMLGGFFSAAVAGFYALGFRILQMPMSLIAGAISQVFHQRAAEAHNAGQLGPLVEALFKRLFFVALFPMLLLTIIGRDLYVVVFGEQWAQAGVYTQILGVWALVWFVASPMSHLFGVLGRQEQGLRIQILIFLSRLISLSIGILTDNATVAIALFSASGIVVYGYLTIITLQHARIRVDPIARFVKDTLLKTAPYLAVTLSLTLVLKSSILVLWAATTVTALYLWSTRSELSAMLNRDITCND